MVQVINRAGFKFIPIDSNYVEVYHPKATYPDQPVEVVRLDSVNEAAIKRLANGTSEYAHL